MLLKTIFKSQNTNSNEFLYSQILFLKKADTRNHVDGIKAGAQVKMQLWKNFLSDNHQSIKQDPDYI